MPGKRQKGKTNQQCDQAPLDAEEVPTTTPAENIAPVETIAAEELKKKRALVLN